MQKLFGKFDTSMAFYNAEECHYALPHWQKEIMGVPYYNQSPKMIWDEICRRKVFDVYEFVNYGCGDMSIARAAINYAELRAQGIHYPIIGNSDAHRVEDQGSSYTVVFAKSNSMDDIKEAIMSRRSVAVAEFGYMDKTQKDFGRPARLAFGEDRFVRFAYFLFLHYFPDHSESIAEEGKILRDILLNKNASESNLKRLSQCAEKSRKAYREFVA